MSPSDLDRWLFLSGTSERRLAAMAGVTRTTLQRWRAGVTYPQNGSLARLNEAILQRNSELLEAIDLGYLEVEKDASLCCA